MESRQRYTELLVGIEMLIKVVELPTISKAVERDVIKSSIDLEGGEDRDVMGRETRIPLS